MHAENRRDSRIAQESGNRLVGGDHGLFDKRRRVGFPANGHADGRAFIVQANLSLFALEIHAPATYAIGMERLSDFVQNANRLRNVFGEGASHRPQGHNRRLRIARPQSVDGNLHGAIRKPRFRLDDRRRYAHVSNKALFVDEHLDAHRATLFMRSQRTHIVRKRFGKHGQHAIDQIHARRAFASLEVDLGIPGNVVRNIGNMHAQDEETRARSGSGIVHRACNSRLEAVPLGGKRLMGATKRCGAIEPNARRAYGIVEIFRIVRVYRERELASQIDIASAVEGGIGIDCSTLHFGKRRCRKRGCQFMASNNELDIGPGLAFMPKNFLHHTLRGLSPRRERGHAHAHDVAIFHMGSIAAQSEDVMLDARVFGNNNPKGFGDFISPDNRFVRAADHANHAPAKPVVKAAIAFAIVNASDFHHIAIEGVGRLRGGNKKFPFGSLHKAVSSARHFQNALRQNARGTAGRAFSCT